MKKVICLLLLVAIAIIPLCGCVEPNNSLSGTTPDTQPDTGSTTQPDETTDNVTTDQTDVTEDDLYALYHEIEDDRITIEGSKKAYRDNGITFSVPADWRFLEAQGEDGLSVHILEPNIGKDCVFTFYITSSVYAHERTEDEYLEYFASPDRTDVKIKSLTKETLSGFTCTKVVSSYSYEGTEYIRIDYDNVVTGFRLYDFLIKYPASESETFDAVFETIVGSLELTPI